MPRRTEQQIDVDLAFVREMKTELIMKAGEKYEDSLAVQKVTNPEAPAKIEFVFTEWLSNEDKELVASLNDGEGKLLYEKRFAGKTDEEIDETLHWRKVIYEGFLSQAIALNNPKAAEHFRKQLGEVG